MNKSYAFLFGEYVASRLPGLVMNDAVIQAARIYACNNLGTREALAMMSKEGFEEEVLAGYRSVV